MSLIKSLREIAAKGGAVKSSALRANGERRVPGKEPAAGLLGSVMSKLL